MKAEKKNTSITQNNVNVIIAFPSFFSEKLNHFRCFWILKVTQTTIKNKKKMVELVATGRQMQL